eukprot:gene5424-3909_t
MSHIFHLSAIILKEITQTMDGMMRASLIRCTVRRAEFDQPSYEPKKKGRNATKGERK